MTDGCKEKSGVTHRWLHLQVFSTPTPGVLQCATVLLQYWLIPLLTVRCLAVSSHPVFLFVCACMRACYSVTFTHVASASLVSDLRVAWFLYITNVYLLQHRNSTTTTTASRQFSSFKLQNCCGKVWDCINWIMMKTICIVSVLTSVVAAACFAKSRQTIGSIKAGGKQRIPMQINLKSLSRLSVLQS